MTHSTDTPRGDDAVQADGRKRRRIVNRQKCLAALVDLVREGHLEPGAEDVARRAGVGLRTVFRLFDDMEGLYRGCADIVRAEVMPLVEQPLLGETLDARIDELVTRRMEVFERIMPFRTFSDVHRHKSHYLQTGYDNLVAQQRATLVRAVGEATRLGTRTFEALDLLLSFESWRRLRQDQKLSRTKARDTLLAAARAILGL